MAKQGMRDSECSVFVGNLDPRVSEEILWELFLQAGPIKSIYIPCDKESGKQRSFAFVEFSSSVSAHYAWELLDGIKLYKRPLTVRPQSSQNGDTARRMPSNVMSASDFYNDFYNKYEELKSRPQSEPRRNQWSEEYSHQRNSSFSHPTMNRSLSSPANSVNPALQQLLNIINPGQWNNSTPYRSSPSLRIANQGSSQYAGSPPYVGSPQYGRSPPYAGSPPYGRSQSSDTQFRSSPHGYLPRQSPYRR